MRIVHIMLTGTFTEGLGYQENLLTEYQVKHHHDVILVVPTQKRDDKGDIVETPEGEEYLSNDVLLVRKKNGNSVTKLFGWYACVPRVLEKYQPDFIFVHGLCTMIPGQAIRYKQKHPAVTIVADSHQDAGNTYTKGLICGTKIKLYRAMWKRWIQYVSRVYGTTSWRTTFAHEVYGIPKEKLDTLIMGVNIDSMPSDFQLVRSEVRKELEIPEDSFVFVNGGKINKYKNMKETLEIFNEINDSNTYFILFGKVFDDVKDEIEKLIKSNSHIKYLGFIDGTTTHRYLIASDFGMFPGRHSCLWEEAIGCGLPCVFGKYEEIDHTDVNGNCIRLENATEDSIRKVMKKVLDDKEFYTNIRANAHAAASSFSYHTIAEKSVECMEVDDE